MCIRYFDKVRNLRYDVVLFSASFSILFSFCIHVRLYCDCHYCCHFCSFIFFSFSFDFSASYIIIYIIRHKAAIINLNLAKRRVIIRILELHGHGSLVLDELSFPLLRHPRYAVLRCLVVACPPCETTEFLSILHIGCHISVYRHSAGMPIFCVCG